MAEVVVRVDDFETGALPPWCVATGAEGGRLRRFEARFEPSWPLVLLVLGPPGLLVALVLIHLLTRRVDGWLPLTDAAVARRDRSRLVAIVVAVAAGVAAFGAGAALWSAGAFPALWAVGVLGAAAVTGAVVLASRPLGSVATQLAADGRTVTVSRVHDRFAASYDAGEIERRRAERDATARA